MAGKAIGNNVKLLCNISVAIKRMKWDPAGFIPNIRDLRILPDNQVVDKTQIIIRVHVSHHDCKVIVITSLG